MDDSSDLPPLPDYAKEFRPRWGGNNGGFTADQMQAYARAAVEAEREACAQVGFMAAINGIEVAAAIRERGKKS